MLNLTFNAVELTDKFINDENEDVFDALNEWEQDEMLLRLAVKDFCKNLMNLINYEIFHNSKIPFAVVTTEMGMIQFNIL